MSNLTENQKSLLRGMVAEIRNGTLPEEFYVVWGVEGAAITFEKAKGFFSSPEITRARLEALKAEKFISCTYSKDDVAEVSLTQAGYNAVDNNFLDTSPLASEKNKPHETVEERLSKRKWVQILGVIVLVVAVIAKFKSDIISIFSFAGEKKEGSALIDPHAQAPSIIVAGGSNGQIANNITNNNINHQLTQEEIQNIVKATLGGLKTDEIEQRYPGFAICLVIALKMPPLGQESYIFDSGQSISKNRISVFFDTRRDLCFRVIDKNGIPYGVKVPLKLETFPIGSAFFLQCEFGKTPTGSIVRIAINGRTAAEEKLTQIIIVEDIFETKKTIAKDLEDKNIGAFQLSEMMWFKSTVVSSDIKRILDFLNSDMQKYQQ